MARPQTPGPTSFIPCAACIQLAIYVIRLIKAHLVQLNLLLCNSALFVLQGLHQPTQCFSHLVTVRIYAPEDLHIAQDKLLEQLCARGLSTMASDPVELQRMLCFCWAGLVLLSLI